ncbi:MAG: septum formation initiator family protein [Patescibacteria group bacterium]
MERQKVPKNKKNRKSLIFLLGGVIILIIIAVNLIQTWKKNREINQEIGGLNQQIQDLEKNNLEAKKLIEYLNSDAYIEEKARMDLGLKKEGEKVIIVSNTSVDTNSDSSTDLEKQKTISNPKKWWRYFFQ